MQVNTDANGDNSAIYLTTLVQCLKLNLGESPFYGNYGIPARQSIVTGVFPDFYCAQTQSQFAPYFASLAITRIQGTYPPAYQVNAVCHNGAQIGVQVSTGQIEVPS